MQLQNNSYLILFVVGIFNFWNKITPLYLYILGWGILSLFVKYLKLVLKIKRPSVNTNAKNVKRTGFLGFNYKCSAIPVNYGMPSGHAADSIYTLGFIYLIYQKITIGWIIAFIVSIFIVYERIYCDKHNMNQILVGMVLGGLVSVLLFTFYKVIGTKLRSK